MAQKDDELENINAAFKKTPNELWTANVSGNIVKLYGYLLSTGEKFNPTQHVMARQTRISRATIERLLPEMVDLKMIERGPVTPKGTQTYRVLHPSKWDPSIKMSQMTQNEGNEDAESFPQNESNDSLKMSQMTQIDSSKRVTNKKEAAIKYVDQGRKEYVGKVDPEGSRPSEAELFDELRRHLLGRPLTTVPSWIAKSIEEHGVWAEPAKLHEVLDEMLLAIMPKDDPKWDNQKWRGRPKREVNRERWHSVLDVAVKAARAKEAAAQQAAAEEAARKQREIDAQVESEKLRNDRVNTITELRKKMTGQND